MNEEKGISRLDDEMVELPLLLPTWQAAALERVAREQGLTAGQAVRRLIQGFCTTPPEVDAGVGRFVHEWN